MNIHTIKNSILQSATYVLHDSTNHEAWLVDCGDYKPILSYLQANNLDLKGVFLTHTHYDHIYGLNDIFNNYSDITVYTNDFGKQALYDSILNLSFCYDTEFEYLGNRIHILRDGDFLLESFGQVQVVSTPGHDRTCLSYIIGNMFFTGDSYIPGHDVVTCWHYMLAL